MKNNDLVFPEDTIEMYRSLNEKLSVLTADEKKVIPNLANAASLLAAALERINWAGFYLMSEGQLVLGPFMGNPACIRIPVGNGVCGVAAETNEAQVVDDVKSFPGYISCDASTLSEIVIPIHYRGTVVAVLDIDSPERHRFGKNDLEGLTRFVEILEDACDWAPFKVL